MQKITVRKKLGELLNEKFKEKMVRLKPLESDEEKIELKEMLKVDQKVP